MAIDAEKGVQGLLNDTNKTLVIVSDWSKQGSGFCLYQVTCDCTTKWPTESSTAKEHQIKPLCCPEEWKLIIAGGRYNTPTEAAYVPVEGELLGVTAALHKSTYFISEHPNVRVITDHQPLVNYLADKSRVVENRRLNNLRRKTDAYIFKIHYGAGVTNISDGISRIEDWNRNTDKDRLHQVSDIDIEACETQTRKLTEVEKEIQTLKSEVEQAT